MSSQLQSRSQKQMTTESSNYKLSSDNIEELQEEAEQLFGQLKYLQSAKIAAQIASACESKEYSAEVVAKFNQVCVSDLIAKSKFSAAVLVLKEILAIVQNSLLKEGEDAILPENFAEYQNLKRLTLNNLGCALKKSGQIDEAQFYFEQITNQDPLYELNLCAVQNQKGNHRQALVHAQQAATLLEAEVKDLRAQLEKGDLEDSTDKDFFLERTSLLAIAYYNQGCELEHLENLMRATQAFSRAVSLQSSKHANQQLLTQFKLSLKQARFKLRQQMVPGNTLSQTQMMRETTMSVPIFHDGNKFGAYNNQSISLDKRPFSALNNQPISPYRFQSAGSKKQLPKIAKVQNSSVYSIDKKQNMVMRMSIHSNMSHNSHQSDLSEQQQAMVDQMNQRPTRQDQRFSRGKKQANQSGSNSNSLRQKQKSLKVSQPDLGTGLGYSQSRSVSAIQQKTLKSHNVMSSPAKKNQTMQQSLPPIAQSKSKVQTESHKVLPNYYTKSVNKKVEKNEFTNKPPIASQLKSYPNKLNDNSKALKALKDLGLAKGSALQQQKSLDSIMKIQRWIRVRIIRKNFLKVIRNHVLLEQNKNASLKSKQTALSVQKKKNMMNVVSSFDKFGSGPNVAKKQKCARMIQSWFRRSRFRKLVHAMIVRRKVQLGYYSKSKLDQIEQSTLKRLQDLDKKFRNAQVTVKKQEQKRIKAIKLIQSLVRRRRFRKIVASVAKAAKESAKNGQKASQVKSNMREAFIKKILQKAKEIREAEIRHEIIHRENLKNSVRVLQSWIRRRRFRKAVHAMVLFKKVSSGRLPASHLKKVDAATYNAIVNATKIRKFEEKQQKQEKIKEKAAQMIQGMFRRRRFRNLVDIIIKILKETRASQRNKKNTSFSVQEKERKATLQAAFLRHKAQVASNAIFQVKKKKAIRLIQSFVRRRKFRRLIQARLLLHKFEQGRVKASALRNIDPKIRETILNADRKQNLESKKQARSIKVIQSFVRRRKFRQLVYWMIQVRKLSNQQSGSKNKKLTDRQISQLAQKANLLRKKNNLQLIQQRRSEKIARKVIQSFVRRWRFRRAVQALIAKKKARKQGSKPLTAAQQQQLRQAAAIQKTRDEIVTFERQKEICARMLQRFIRVRRFRKTIEAIVEINRRHRDSNMVYDVMFKQKVWEARALKKKWDYERIVRNRKEKKAIKLLQSFIRRRNFRKVVEAILLQIRIKRGRATAKQMKKANVSPLVKKQMNDWNQVVSQAQSQKKKLLKATRMIQSWYRRRKFRKLVEAMIELRKGGNRKGQKTKGTLNLEQANIMRKKLNKQEISEKKKTLKAVKLVQRWFRRRKFRQLVFAMVVRSQVQKKKLSGAALDKFNKQTLDRLNRADQYQKQQQMRNKKEERAIRLVQRWYRMRRFRKAVWAVIEAGRQLRSNWANSRHYLSAKEKLLFDERIVIKANFLRKQALQNEIDYKARLKRSTKFLQSWWRRRKFRNLVNQVLAKKRKFRQIPDKSKVASDKKPIAFKASTVGQSPSKTLNQQQFASRNFASPQKSKNLTETISRKPAEQTTSIGTPAAETSSQQKIVIDYWQDGMQVVFQQAFTKKKPLVMVNLVINSQTVDRKVIQIDLYRCALDAGDYDLHHFCDQWLMPCIQIKEKNGRYSLEILEELVSEFQSKNNLNEFEPQRVNTASSFGRGSEQNEGTLKLLQKKLTGMMPLVKRNAILDNKEYVVSAICDFDMQVIKLTAEREDAYLFLNVQMTQHLSPVSSDQLPSICSYATDLTHQLAISRDELQLRKAIPCLHDDEVLLRTSANIRERFYLISIGHQGGNLIIEALDKAREIRLQLKLGKHQVSTQLNQDEAQKLVSKLDTKTVAGETVLILK